jgi:hypothetical protein
MEAFRNMDKITNIDVDLERDETSNEQHRRLTVARKTMRATKGGQGLPAPDPKMLEAYSEKNHQDNDKENGENDFKIVENRQLPLHRAHTTKRQTMLTSKHRRSIMNPMSSDEFKDLLFYEAELQGGKGSMENLRQKKLENAKAKLEKWKKDYGKGYVCTGATKKSQRDRLVAKRKKRLRNIAEAENRQKRWLKICGIASRQFVFNRQYATCSRTLIKIKHVMQSISWLRLYVRVWRRKNAAKNARKFIRDFTTRHLATTFTMSARKLKMWIIRGQRCMKSFVACQKARRHALLRLWDRCVTGCAF